MDIIQKALEINDLDHLKLAALDGFNEKELEILELFWQPDMNNSWFYISRKMVIEWLKEPRGKNVMSNFYKNNLIMNYEENVDYRAVDQNDDVIKKFYSSNLRNEKLGNRTKYYLITGECLKSLLMSAKTVKGKEVRKYFIKVEKLAQLMIQVIKEKEIIEFRNKLQIAESKNLQLTTKIKDLQVLKVSGFIYIATTKQYSQYNQYKIGKTDKLDARMPNYQAGRVKSDEMYYTYVFETEDPLTLEMLLKRLLDKFRAEKAKEMFTIPYNLLYKYVDYVCLTFRNGLINELNTLIIDNLDSKGDDIIPEPLDFKNKENIINIKISKFLSLDEMLYMFNNWFYENYEYVNDDELYITMKDIYYKFKESSFYKCLKSSEKKILNKNYMLDKLLEDKKLSQLFTRNRRYYGNNAIFSSFINYQIK